MQLSNIKSAHFFAWCGGDIEGFKMAGLQPEFAVEINPARCATLRHNHPELTVFDQPIEKLVMADYPTVAATSPILVHVYTFPCTNYTLAGEVHKHRTGDALYLEALREAVIQWPEIIVIENVLGMRAFPRVMETWCNLAHYHTSEFVVNGEDFTLQRKARLFLILHRQPFQFKPLTEYLPTFAVRGVATGRAADGRTRLADYLDAEPDVANKPYILKRLNGEYQRLPNVYERDRTEPLPLTTNYKRDRSNHLVRDERFPGGVRPFAVEELARLHGYPEGYHFAGGINERYGQVIDSVMPPVAKAIGLALQAYFEAIPELGVQPKPLGHTQVLTVGTVNSKVKAKKVRGKAA